jgi:hypothetical protein
MECRIQLGMDRTRHLQRVDGGGHVPADEVGVHELGDTILLPDDGVSIRPTDACFGTTIAFRIKEGFRRTRRAAPPSHGVIAIGPRIPKIVPPLRRDRGRVSQELHIQILHEREVGEQG